MAEKSDKKTIIILLTILAIVIIGGGIWTYNTLGPLDVTDTPSNILDPKIQEVFIIKKKSGENIQDFLEVEESPSTVWNELYFSKQFNSLRDINLEIKNDNYLNNPNPFVLPSKANNR